MKTVLDRHFKLVKRQRDSGDCLLKQIPSIIDFNKKEYGFNNNRKNSLERSF
jgi:hypothetical protein